jgi:hypothetical protein
MNKAAILIDVFRDPGRVLNGGRHPALFCFVVCTIIISPFAAVVVMSGSGPLIVRLAILMLLLVVCSLGMNWRGHHEHEESDASRRGR